MIQPTIQPNGQPSSVAHAPVMVSPLRELPPQSSLQVVLFPPAGGGFISFRPWVRPPGGGQQPHFPAAWGISGVQFEWSDPWTCDSLVPAISDALEAETPSAPMVFIGVSLGALLAFLLARYRRQLSLTEPLGLAAVAMSPPRLFEPHRRADFEGWDLTRWHQEFVRLGAIAEDTPVDPARLAPQAQRLLDSLPLAGSFIYRKEPPLSAHVVVLGGERDEEFQPETWGAWEQETSRTFGRFIYPRARHLGVLTDPEVSSRALADLIDTVQSWLEGLA